MCNSGMVVIATRLARLRQTKQSNINKQTSKTIMGTKVLKLNCSFVNLKTKTVNWTIFPHMGIYLSTPSLCLPQGSKNEVPLEREAITPATVVKQYN